MFLLTAALNYVHPLQVFYRKGIDGMKAYTNVENACGSGWIEMVGDFKLISVGPNDQVIILNTWFVWELVVTYLFIYNFFKVGKNNIPVYIHSW